MQVHKNLKEEKRIALFEIFILVISIASFSYFIGGLPLVGASGKEIIPQYTPPSTQEMLESGTLTPAAPATPVPVTTNPYYTPVSVPEEAAGGIGYVPGETAGASGTGYGGGALGTGGSTIPQTPAATTASEFNLVQSIANNWQIIAVNVAIATGLYFGITFLLPLVCPTCDPKLAEEAAAWVTGGYSVGAGLATIGNILGLWTLGLMDTILVGGVGALVGLIIFLLVYRDEYIMAIQYTCYPWQPKSGGEDCTKCNNGEYPCTKYKCQSLGQRCELLNPGTSDELCTFVDRNDISEPIISAWKTPLTEGYEYVPDTARLPPDKGVIIKYKNSADGCAPPFSMITYGVTLNKPAQCRVDTQRKNSFGEMTNPGLISLGRSIYNHTIISLALGVSEAKAESIVLPTGGEYETYVRCNSSNGYANVGTFVFKYCVKSEPDTTAATIVGTSVISGMPVGHGQTDMYTEVYLDKPADCRWSHNDEDYDTMANQMDCSKAQKVSDIGPNMLYTCTTTLTGLLDDIENNFYFRCNSYPSHDTDGDPATLRYKNVESYPYKLIGTQPLVLDWVKPEDGDLIKGASNSINVTLSAQTSAGYNTGVSECKFKKSSESDTKYISFWNTNSYKHSTDLWLPKGSYSYTIKCWDLGGNSDTETIDFDVDTDFQSPVIVRIYNEGGDLKIITGEDAECVYDTTSCSYNFDDGIEMTSMNGRNHLTGWDTNNFFYIKCRDDYGNQPMPDSCSIVLRPFSSY